MSEVITVEEQIKIIPRDRYDQVKWSHDEILFRHRLTTKNKFCTEYVVTFSLAMLVKLKGSVFGTYLEYFNYQQNQDQHFNNIKWGITNWFVTNFTELQSIKFKYDNDMFNDSLSLLGKSVEKDMIDWKLLHKSVDFLRLDNYHICQIDKSLRKFRNLKILVLCGNWIGDVDGEILPRKLNILELYANEIRSVKNLSQNAPTNISLLSLGRNSITNDSELHLLESSKMFTKLKVLDFSDCDIYNLIDVLNSIKNLDLSGLFLDGNPCAMVVGYKNAVFNYFPRLIYLDGIEIHDKDKTPSQNYKDMVETAEFIFYVRKINNLPSPPKQKKNIKQTIHFGFDLPLFYNIPLESESQEKIEKVEEKPPKKNKKEKKKKQKKQKASKKGGKAIYGQKDDFETGINYFQTPPKKWSKKLSFPAVPVSSPEENLTDYRDTFRTCVNVQLIYLMVEIPKKEKKKKKSKKGKSSKKSKDSKKSKKSKGKDKKSSKSKDEKDQSNKKKPPEKKEITLKRIILADFYCELYNINWKEKSIDFYWDSSQKPGSFAIPEYIKNKPPEIKEPKIEEKPDEKGKKSKKGAKDKKKDKKKKDSKSSKKSSKKSKKNKKKKGKKKDEKKYLNCVIGFGLKRL